MKAIRRVDVHFDKAVDSELFPHVQQDFSAGLSKEGKQGESRQSVGLLVQDGLPVSILYELGLDG